MGVCAPGRCAETPSLDALLDAALVEPVEERSSYWLMRIENRTADPAKAATIRVLLEELRQAADGSPMAPPPPSSVDLWSKISITRREEAYRLDVVADSPRRGHIEDTVYFSNGFWATVLPYDESLIIVDQSKVLNYDTATIPEFAKSPFEYLLQMKGLWEAQYRTSTEELPGPLPLGIDGEYKKLLLDQEKTKVRYIRMAHDATSPRRGIETLLVSGTSEQSGVTRFGWLDWRDIDLREDRELWRPHLAYQYDGIVPGSVKEAEVRGRDIDSPLPLQEYLTLLIVEKRTLASDVADHEVHPVPGKDFDNVYFGDGKSTSEMRVLTAEELKLPAHKIEGLPFTSREVSSPGTVGRWSPITIIALILMVAGVAMSLLLLVRRRYPHNRSA